MGESVSKETQELQTLAERATTEHGALTLFQKLLDMSWTRLLKLNGSPNLKTLAYCIAGSKNQELLQRNAKRKGWVTAVKSLPLLLRALSGLSTAQRQQIFDGVLDLGKGVTGHELEEFVADFTVRLTTACLEYFLQFHYYGKWSGPAVPYKNSLARLTLVEALLKEPQFPRYPLLPVSVLAECLSDHVIGPHLEIVFKVPKLVIFCYESGAECESFEKRLLKRSGEQPDLRRPEWKWFGAAVKEDGAHAPAKQPALRFATFLSTLRAARANYQKRREELRQMVLCCTPLIEAIVDLVDLYAGPQPFEKTFGALGSTQSNSACVVA